VIKEIIDTEEDYIRDLEVIINVRISTYLQRVSNSDLTPFLSFLWF